MIDQDGFEERLRMDDFEEDLRQSIINKVDRYYFENNLNKDKLYAELILIISGV